MSRRRPNTSVQRLGTYVLAVSVGVFACSCLRPPDTSDTSPEDGGTDGTDGGDAANAVVASGSAIAVGGEHACALREDGVYCWGNNRSGQAGVPRDDGMPGAISAPARLDTALEFVHLTAGSAHTCGLNAAGEAYCWGRDESGELGAAAFVDRWTAIPRRVAGGYDFLKLEASSVHTCGLTTLGELVCWGDNSNSELSAPAAEIRRFDAPVLIDHGVDYVDFAVGAEHMCALAGDDMTISCWGDPGRASQFPPPMDGAQLEDETPDPQPVGAAELESARPAAIAAGNWHTCLLADDRQTYCWGENENGQVDPQLNTGSDFQVPAQQSLPMLDVVAPGDRHTCGVSEGAVHCWGRRTADGVADPAMGEPKEQPLTVATDNLEGEAFVEVDSGSDFSCARTDDGNVYCWGEGADGRLGQGDDLMFDPPDHQIPVKVEFDAPDPDNNGTADAGMDTGSASDAADAT